MKKKLATNVSQFYIAKAYWKTFMYKLEYNFDDPSRGTKGSQYWDSTWQVRADHANRRRTLWNIVQGFSRAVKRFAKEHNIKVKTRAENGSVSVFVEREEDAVLILTKYKTNLNAIWVPYNTTQVEINNSYSYLSDYITFDWTYYPYDITPYFLQTGQFRSALMP